MLPNQTHFAAGLLLGALLASCSGGDRGLKSIALSPTSSSIAAGTSLQFTALGTYWSGEVQDLTAIVSWTSSDSSVATVDHGLVTGLVVGITSIEVIDPESGVADSTGLAITPAVLSSLSLTPTLPRIALGTSVQFTAMGTYSDNTVLDLTGLVDWDSSLPTVATVSAGLAQSQGVGSTTITATEPGTGIQAPATLSVTPAVLTSIAVTPTDPSIALGTTQQFTATGTYSDATTQDLTGSVVWSSSIPAVVTVSNALGSKGLATSVATGLSTLAATDPATSIDGSTTLTVTPAILASIAVMPTDPSIALGTAQQFTATGTFSDASTQDLTGSVAWGSSSPAAATISNAPGSEGLVTSVSTGLTTISATDPATAIDGTTTLTVTPATLTSLAVTPADPSIALGTTQQFTATGTYSDATTQDLTETVTWISGNSAIATVSNAPGTEGLATSLATGLSTLTATHPATSIDDSTTLTVTPAILTSISVTPVDPFIALGTSQQFTATGTYSDSSTQDLTDSVTWSSSTPAVATISNAAGNEGLTTSVATGLTALTATDPVTSIDDVTTLTVTTAVLVSIEVTPTNLTVPVGATRQLAATGTYSDASTQDVTDSVTWSSGSPAVATVSNASGSEGRVTGVSVGSTTIQALDATSGVNDSEVLEVVQDISFRAAASLGSANGLFLAVPTPSSTQAGDVLVASIGVRPSTATITPPAGWTLVRRIDNASDNSNALAIFVRVAVAAEPPDHTWAFSTSTGSVGGIAAFYGADPSAPVHVEEGQSTPSSLVHSTPNVTTTRTATMLITSHAYSSSTAWTPPGGMTEAFEVASLAMPNGAGISLELNYALQSVAGATGAKSATASADPDTGNAHILALSPGS